MMNLKKAKEKIFMATFFVFCAIILIMAVKGLPGNPTAEELNSSRWTEDGPFGTSNDRGRFALLYSVVEDKSLTLSTPLASFSMPDLAINKNGEHVSLFAPGIPFIMIPSYLVGRHLGMSQMGVYLTVAFFAFLNIILLRAISIKLGASPIASSLGAFIFIFATPAFVYATTLYQHHISTFVVLLGLYVFLRWNTWWSMSIIWFLYALSGAIDNPNYIIMFPIAMCAAGRMIIFKNNEKELAINFRLARVLTLLSALVPITFFLWFNKNSNGDMLMLSGSLKRVDAIENSIDAPEVNLEKSTEALARDNDSSKSSPIGFFRTRNLLNGFYIYFFSPDRGIIHYSPILILGIFGLALFYIKRSFAADILVATAGITVLLYSMWGDPYGGWAFGSRYLIPVYAILSIGVAVALFKLRENYIFLAVFIVLFVYSARINTLGALTTNANPPRVEILALEELTGKTEKYTEERNWDYLQEKGSRSFIFQTVAKNKMSAESYYWLITSLIIISGLILVLGLIKFNGSTEATSNSE